MPDAAVDAVIAVHDPRRRVGRAVSSVLRDAPDGVRVTVVCHNTPVDGIAAALRRDGADPDDARITLRELHDDVPSPAGPFNLGIEAATAQFVSVMGSDDTLEPGAIRSWLSSAARPGVRAVIPRLRHANGVYVATPVVRPLRAARLDLVRDRLSYRSAPLGLVAASAVRRLGLRMTEGVAVGEDVAFVPRLWSSGERLAFDRGGPAYVIGDDAEERVTYTRRPVATELEFVRRLVQEGWFASLPPARRRAVVTKLVRIHVFGAVLHRPEAAWWTATERESLRDVTALALAVAPRAAAPLAVADRRLLDAVLDPSVPAARLVALAVARRRFGMPSTLVPRDLSQVLAREAPVRFSAASLLLRR